MTEPTKGWAVVGRDGEIELLTVAHTYDAAWEKAPAALWRHRANLEARGYRAIRVTITPEKDDE